MSNITLPRAVGLHIRNSLRGIVNASDDDCGEEKCRDCAPVRVMREALAALEAALAWPPAKPEPITEDALREWLDAQDRDLWQRRADEAFLKEYEKRHGITKEDKT